ncbi:recombinase family protein [Xinfangfangia sp. CPCC 101601]|uniref:Recombinase family protein n=1 Tax=Pseudogemmobacter lacusdianii TaxID=3069608 RepID=A0ABU0W208_9RHOB|nr:recombinase family protein [Xinfangfangia sp. CPCC 101601]MDQ2067928.1 recombinase family protein [Xinfangfangia sp. CPCC 101601]
MLRAAIYARFSTNLQSDRSIDDQFTLCRFFADQRGYSVVQIYSDAAKSGASIFDRDGLRQMLKDAEAGAYDVLIVEAFDRLSRDQADMHSIFRHLTFNKVNVLSVNDGSGDTINVTLRGLMSQLYREDNAHKVRRGLTGRIQDGLSAGGRSYGYRADPLRTGVLVIDEEQAAVVRRIFEAFKAGKSPRAIARELNEAGVPAPKSKHWTASTLLGSASRHNGILHNPLYIGERIWNRQHFLKHPATGRRVSRPNPPEDWKRAQVPELRIISDELWAHAASHRRPGRPFKEARMMRRPQHPLSGLIYCGACGAPMHLSGKDRSGKARLRCSAIDSRAACKSQKTFFLDEVHALLFPRLVAQLGQSEEMQLTAQSWYDQRLEDVAVDLARREEIKVALQSVDQKHMNIMDKAALGIIPDDILLPYIERIRTERDQLLGELVKLATEPEVPVIQHDVTADLITFLAAGVSELTSADRRLSLLRKVIRAIVVHYVGTVSRKFKLEVLLDLAALTDPNATATAAEPLSKHLSAKDVIEFRFSI